MEPFWSHVGAIFGSILSSTSYFLLLTSYLLLHPSYFLLLAFYFLLLTSYFLLLLLLLQFLLPCLLLRLLCLSALSRSLRCRRFPPLERSRQLNSLSARASARRAKLQASVRARCVDFGAILDPFLTDLTSAKFLGAPQARKNQTSMYFPLSSSAKPDVFLPPAAVYFL